MSILPKANYEARVDPLLIQLLEHRFEKRRTEPGESHALARAGIGTHPIEAANAPRPRGQDLEDFVLRQDGQRPVRCRASLIWTETSSQQLEDGRSVTRTLSIYRDRQGAVLAHAVLQPDQEAAARPVYRARAITEPIDLASFKEDMTAELCFRVAHQPLGRPSAWPAVPDNRSPKPATALA